MRKKMPLFVYVIESEEGQFLGYSVHAHGEFHDLPADPATSFGDEFVERCILKTEKRTGTPSVAVMERLMGTLVCIVSGLRSSGASSHEVTRLYANLKVSKEHLELERAGRLGSDVQCALRGIEEASEFIASYREGVT